MGGQAAQSSKGAERLEAGHRPAPVHVEGGQASELAESIQAGHCLAVVHV